MLMQVQEPLDKLDTSKENFKQKLDKLVERGYLSRVKHQYHDIYLYCYTNKCIIENFWSAYTRSIRGVVLDSYGNVLSCSVPRIPIIGIDATLAEIPKTSFVAYEKIDGIQINGFWYKDELILHTKDAFEHVYIKQAWNFYKNKFKFAKNFGYKTVVTELIPFLGKDGKPAAIVNKDPGLYLIAAIDKNFRDIDLIALKHYWYEEKFPRTDWRAFGFGQASIQEFMDLKDKIANTEGWVLRFKNDKGQVQRYGIRTGWYQRRLNTLFGINLKIHHYLNKGSGKIEDLIKIVNPKSESVVSEVKDILSLIGQHIDTQKVEIGKELSELYSTYPNQTIKILQEAKKSKYNRYLIESLTKEQDWTPALLKDALNIYAKL